MRFRPGKGFILNHVDYVLGVLGFDWTSDLIDLARSWSVASLKRTENINADNAFAFRAAA